MKRDSWKRDKKILVTLAVTLGLMALTSFISWRINRLEEQSCWMDLQAYVARVDQQLQSRISGDQELLASLAEIIAQQDSVTSTEVQEILDTFTPRTMISHIGLLLPGDWVMLPNDPVRYVGQLMSFQEEAAKGAHISDRSVDVRDGTSLLLRSFVPVVRDGETVAMLYGVVNLQTMPDQWQNSIYGEQSAVYLIDRDTGDYLMNTADDSLGNISVMEHQMDSGYDEMLRALRSGEEGCSIVNGASEEETLYFYYLPASINHWMLGVSVPESEIFSRVEATNYLLIGFNIVELTTLVLYFIWILHTTKKEVEEKQRLAETDVLTGLLNRNRYEACLTGYSARCRENLSCIYVDVNGLHDLNNSEGHEAGDQMLRAVAQAIRTQFGASNSYRIGGDEFVAFVADQPPEEIRLRMETLDAQLSREGYHVSMGLARQEVPIEIEAMIKQAERQMYAAKRRYYEQTGVDRRSRPKS